LAWLHADDCTCLAQLPKPAAITISGYIIDAELDPEAHHLTAKAVVSFTAPEIAEPDSAQAVSFDFHPALKLIRVSDDVGNALTTNALRTATFASLRRHHCAGPALALDVRYEGTITATKKARFTESSWLRFKSSLLTCFTRRAGFSGWRADQPFTARYTFGAQGIKVFGSGSQGEAKQVTLTNGKPGDEYDFSWTKRAFPVR